MRAAGGNFEHLQGVLARFPLAKAQILSVFITEIHRISPKIWCFFKNAPLVSRYGLTRGGAFFKRGAFFLGIPLIISFEYTPLRGVARQDR